MADLSATIAGVGLCSLLMNASGPACTTADELRGIACSASGAVVTKSMTLAPRTGNPEPRYRDVPLGSINSMGLPNLGFEEYCRLLPALREFGKPVIASVAAFSLQEYVTITAAVSHAGFDLVEVNLSCPNISGHPQVGYDFAASARVLESVRDVCRCPLGVKLPPYFDPVHQEEMAALLSKHSVDFVTLINSVGNTLVIDPELETPVIHPRGGFGGLGGEYVKPVALANVRAFAALLGGKIPIIGVGGIYNGIDLFEFLLAGASAVQLGTAYYREGPGIFARVAAELDTVLVRKGYSAARQVVGQLKPLPSLVSTTTV